MSQLHARFFLNSPSCCHQLLNIHVISSYWATSTFISTETSPTPRNSTTCSRATALFSSWRAQHIAADTPSMSSSHDHHHSSLKYQLLSLHCLTIPSSLSQHATNPQSPPWKKLNVAATKHLTQLHSAPIYKKLNSPISHLGQLTKSMST